GGGQYAGGVAVRLRLDLPVHGDPRDRALGHLGLGGGEEGADRRQQGHGDRHAGGGGDEPARAAPDDAVQPAQRSHARCAVVKARRPSRISQRSGSRSATSGSWVATIRAAPLCRAASSSTSTTAEAFSWSSCPVGSSASSSTGWPVSARATATRW